MISRPRELIAQSLIVASLYFYGLSIGFAPPIAWGQAPSLDQNAILQNVDSTPDTYSDAILEASLTAILGPVASFFDANKPVTTTLWRLDQAASAFRSGETPLIICPPPLYFAERQILGAAMNYQILAQSAIDSETAVWAVRSDSRIESTGDLADKRLGVVSTLQPSGGFLQLANLARNQESQQERRLDVVQTGSALDALNYLLKGVIDAAAIPEKSVDQMSMLYPDLQQTGGVLFRILPEKFQGMGSLIAIRADLEQSLNWIDWSRLVTGHTASRTFQLVPAQENQYVDTPRNVSLLREYWDPAYRGRIP